ncbi:MAG: RNA polymerase sigma factor RpoD/SigA [Gemmatimonadota bacterium]
MGSVEQYVREIGAQPLLSRADEAELARRIRAGDEAARERLITANLRFVVSVAKRYSDRGVALADLINEGNLGLLRAARRFDESRKVRFVSYAIWWIRQSMLQAISEQSRMVHVPSGRIERRRKFVRTSNTLSQRLGRRATDEEVATELGVAPGTVNDLSSELGSYISLDAPAPGSASGSLLELVADDGQEDAHTARESAALRHALEGCLTLLSPRDADVLRQYFGLDGEARTLEKIGVDLGVSRERVRQIKDRALDRLRDSSSGRSLEAFLTL